MNNTWNKNARQTADLNIVVVGAGISGLSAAYFLQKAGYQPTILEAQQSPGGRMRQIEMDGLRVNTGARLLYTFNGTVMELISELELEQEMEYLGKSELMCDDGVTKYSISFAPDFSLVTNSNLNMLTRLRLPCLIPALVRARLFCDPDNIGSCDYVDDENMEDYLSRKIGIEYVRKFAEPVFRAARSWKTNEVSPAFFLSTGAHMIGHRTFTFRQGIGYLCEALASRLNIIYGVYVDKIKRETISQGVEITYRENGEKRTIPADIVVCAIEGAKIKDIVANMSVAEQSLSEKVRYNSLGIIYYVLNSSPAHTITLFPAAHPSSLAVMETIPDRNGKACLFCELSPETVTDVSRQNKQDQMAEMIKEATRKLYPSLDEELIYSVNQWIEYMLPVFYPGYIRLMNNFNDYQNNRRQSIYYCGDYLSQALAGGACASGKRIAQSIIRHYQ